MMWILQDPFCTFSEIRKKYSHKFNWKDLRQDFEELIKAGCIHYLLFNGRCFVEAVPVRYNIRAMYYEKVNRIFSIVIENPWLSLNEFFQELLTHNNKTDFSEIKKSKMKKSLLKYNFGIDNTRPKNEQIFSKFFKMLLLEFKIIELGINRMYWDSETYFENREKIESHILKTIPLLDEFESFLINYDRPESDIERLYPDLPEKLDKQYKLAESYLNSYKSRRKSIKHKVKIFYEINEDTKGRVAKNHNVTPKQIRNDVKAVTDENGTLDWKKIVFNLQSENYSRLLN